MRIFSWIVALQGPLSRAISFDFWILLPGHQPENRRRSHTVRVALIVLKLLSAAFTNALFFTNGAQDSDAAPRPHHRSPPGPLGSAQGYREPLEVCLYFGGASMLGSVRSACVDSAHTHADTDTHTHTIARASSGGLLFHKLGKQVVRVSCSGQQGALVLHRRKAVEKPRMASPWNAAELLGSFQKSAL